MIGEKIKILRDDGEKFYFKYKNQMRYGYKQNVLDENGMIVTWRYHDIYNRLNYIYFNAKTRTFHSPHKKLYSLPKLRKHKDSINECNVNYLNFLIKGSL